MSDEYGFSPYKVTIDNLDELDKKAISLIEARGYEIDDIASAAAEYTARMLADGLGVYDVLSVISESPELVRGEEGGSVLREVSDREHFVRSYLGAMRDIGEEIRESDFLGEPELGERFAYVRNQFSDEAYDVLSAERTDPRVRYYKSFRECAAALASGEVDSILLPLEERGGVRLPGVAELIYRYDFRINAVTPVFGLLADADVKYAEISRRFRPLSRSEDDDGYLEIRVPASGAPVSELMAVSELFGMSVYRISTHTVDAEGESLVHISLVLREGECGILPFLTYIAIFAKDALPVGIYKNLE